MGNRTCKVKKCIERRIERSKYCEDHTCKLKKCYNEKNKLNRYCYSHECVVHNCTNKRYYRTMLQKYYSFCKYCKCNVSYCNELKRNDYKYCSEHYLAKN